MCCNWSFSLYGHVGAHNGNGVLASKLICCQAAQFHVRSAFHSTTFHHEFLGRVHGSSHERFQVHNLSTGGTSLVQSNDARVVILRLFLATAQWRVEGPSKLEDELKQRQVLATRHESRKSPSLGRVQEWPRLYLQQRGSKSMGQ